MKPSYYLIGVLAEDTMVGDLVIATPREGTRTPLFERWIEGKHSFNMIAGLVSERSMSDLNGITIPIMNLDYKSYTDISIIKAGTQVGILKREFWGMF